jgi:hypothetical protein
VLAIHQRLSVCLDPHGASIRLAAVLWQVRRADGEEARGRRLDAQVARHQQALQIARQGHAQAEAAVGAAARRVAALEAVSGPMLVISDAIHSD